ncbi:hypothetical protein OGAPHI_007054 [Ogataea philodendri]|uniref:chitinase n=1 Tax=Ogataea philodendri TaxID=1378263 RepID=A0A9P8SZ84_9ASCO|nr:uncharacterized protein OGAPHI_007054 [Ogataea philodendri]KAH3660468.1 hypothetical protein OGAPHI_007054 [Ogataea philodendri]
MLSKRILRVVLLLVFSLKICALDFDDLKDTKVNFISAVYYTEWSFYNKHYPIDVPLSQITNIYYAFAKIDPSSESTKWADKNVALEESFPLYHAEFPNSCGARDEQLYFELSGSKGSNEFVNSTGLIGQLSQMKELKKGLKISLAVGGENTNTLFNKITSDDAQIENFSTNLVQTMVDYGFDGLDIDWEFPTTENASKLIALMKSLKEKFESHERMNGLETNSYLLSLALPLDISSLLCYDFEILQKYVSYFNLMGYDMTGPWSEKSGYHSNLYPADDSSGASIDTSVRFLLERIDRKKLILGMPNYGRSYDCMKPGDKFHTCANIAGVEQKKKQCIINYHDLPPDGFIEVYNSTVGSSYAYNQNRGIVFYDSPLAARQKAAYVKQMGLAGGFWWDSYGDSYCNSNNRSLLHNFVDELGGTSALKLNDEVINENFYNGQDDEPARSCAMRRHLVRTKELFNFTLCALIVFIELLLL